jgi:hypothetical protein
VLHNLIEEVVVLEVVLVDLIKEQPNEVQDVLGDRGEPQETLANLPEVSVVLFWLEG